MELKAIIEDEVSFKPQEDRKAEMRRRRREEKMRLQNLLGTSGTGVTTERWKENYIVNTAAQHTGKLHSRDTVASKEGLGVGEYRSRRASARCSPMHSDRRAHLLGRGGDVAPMDLATPAKPPEAPTSALKRFSARSDAVMERAAHDSVQRRSSVHTVNFESASTAVGRDGDGDERGPPTVDVSPALLERFLPNLRSVDDPALPHVRRLDFGSRPARQSSTPMRSAQDSRPRRRTESAVELKLGSLTLSPQSGPAGGDVRHSSRNADATDTSELTDSRIAGSQAGGGAEQQSGYRLPPLTETSGGRGLSVVRGGTPDAEYAHDPAAETTLALDVSAFGMYTEAEVEAERRSAARRAEERVALLTRQLDEVRQELADARAATPDTAAELDSRPREEAQRHDADGQLDLLTDRLEQVRLELDAERDSRVKAEHELAAAKSHATNAELAVESAGEAKALAEQLEQMKLQLDEERRLREGLAESAGDAKALAKQLEQVKLQLDEERRLREGLAATAGAAYSEAQVESERRKAVLEVEERALLLTSRLELVQSELDEERHRREELSETAAAARSQLEVESERLKAARVDAEQAALLADRLDKTNSELLEERKLREELAEHVGKAYSEADIELAREQAAREAEEQAARLVDQLDRANLMLDEQRTLREELDKRAAGAHTAAREAEERAACLGDQLERARREVGEESKQVAKLREELSAALADAQRSQESEEGQAQLRAENERLRGDLVSSAQAYAHLKSRNEKFKNAVATYDSHEKELIAQIRTLRKSLGDVESWNREFKAHAEKRLQEAFEEAGVYRDQARRKEEECVEAKAALSEVRHRLDTVQREHAEDDTVAMLSAEVQDLRRRLEKRANAEAGTGEGTRRAEEAESKLARHTEESNRLKVRLFDTLQTVEGLRTDLEEGRKNVETVQAENEHLKAMCDNLLAKLEVKQDSRGAPIS